MQRGNTSLLLVAVYPWHDVILRPLERLLQQWAQIGYDSFEQVKSQRSLNPPPALVVVCDAAVIVLLRELFPRALFIHVGHGLISKNQTAKYYSAADYVCVSSEYMAGVLTARGDVPRRRFLATGLIQTDRLFSSERSLNAEPRTAAEKNIVYAPTWNDSLSSAPMFGTKLITLLRGGDATLGVLIKPHPHIAVTHPEWIQQWRDLAQVHENVYVSEPDDDLIPVLLGTELMVSDASSAQFHYLALNKPIVLINNPRRYFDRGSFDKRGIEWTWRDIGDSTKHVRHVSALVQKNLEQPLRNQHARNSRREQLFGSMTDGRSCDRVDQAIREIMETELHDR